MGARTLGYRKLVITLCTSQGYVDYVVDYVVYCFYSSCCYAVVSVVGAAAAGGGVAGYCCYFCVSVSGTAVGCTRSLIWPTFWALKALYFAVIICILIFAFL